MSRNSIIVSFIILFVSSAINGVHGQGRGQSGTRPGFYSRSCPTVESVVQSTVASHFRTNPTVAPGLLRMHFHDCFVQGCDASVLISGTGTERTAGANLGLRGFEVIDDAKTRLEAACPGVVSCADILALAARDSVVLTGGRSWAVPTGRRDGRVSLAGNVNNLPGPRDSVAVQLQKFRAFRLNAQDLVALLGGHTIGTTACQFFRHRLFSFTPAGGPDPSINSTFLTQLQNLCPQNGDASVRVGLDAGTPNAFDSSFYQNLRTGRGVLESDQLLWSHTTTGAILQRFLSGSLDFGAEFARSMVKMSNIGVKVGNNGEIRKVCSAVN